MQEAVRGLKSTPNQEDRGKSRPAFYFVKEIKPEKDNPEITFNIVSSSEPSLYRSCPECGEEKPVLMRYEQTYDSPEGDAWEKEAFTLCQKDGKHVLTKVIRPHRF